jgi:hypothetical protein
MNEKFEVIEVWTILDHEKYLKYEAECIVMSAFISILGELIRDFPEDKIVHLSDLDEMFDDNDDE